MKIKHWRRELAEIQASDKVNFLLILRILRGLAEDTLPKSSCLSNCNPEKCTCITVCPDCDKPYKDDK